MTSPDPRIGSLCSGYGGLELALLSVVGGRVVWHAEKDPHPAKVHAAHWPDLPNLGDITAVDWSTIEPVDWLTAGFPCQDLSPAGRGAGIVEGSRSGLWFAVARAIGVLRPRRVLLENVSAIVSRRPGLDVVLADLAALGLDAEWLCVRASDVGAPHERDRWFCLATDALERGRRGAEGIKRGVGLERCLAPAGRPAVPDAENDGHERSGATRPGGHGPADGGDTAAHPDTAEQPREHTREHGAPAAAGSGGSAWGPYRAAIAGWEQVTGRPAPSPVERTRRRLNPRFSEWMMGLPDGWVTDILPRAASLKCIGNGVVPQQAALALSVLLDRQEAA